MTPKDSSTENTVQFRLVQIKTEQFALLPQNNTKEEQFAVNISMQIKIASQEQVLGIFFSFSFESQNNPFIIIAVSTHFNVEPNDWKSLINKKENSITFPKSFLTHLATVSVGATRGILFAKTEGTDFNKYLLPAVDLTQLIPDARTFPLEE